MRAWGWRKYAAGLVLASAWCAPVAAQTACPAANAFQLDWDSFADQNVASGRNFPLTNGAGATRTVTVTMTGDTADITAALNISAGNWGGPVSTKTLWWGQDVDARASNINSATDVIVLTLSFDQPVRDISLALFDVDYRPAAFRDWVRITGRDGAATYTPVLTTPHGNGNAGPPTNANSSITVGPATSGVSIPATDAVGNSLNDTAENRGNLNIAFAQPVTSIEIRYANGPTGWTPVEAQTAYQVLNVGDIRFCAMPSLTVLKSSAPLVSAIADPNRFNIPGADVVYSITATNTGQSNAELAGVVMTDTLPAQMSFFNGDFDGGGPIIGPYELVTTGGATSVGGAVEYSSTASAAYGYVPAAGYDPLVDAFRLSATSGVIPPGASITVRFRAQIK